MNKIGTILPTVMVGLGVIGPVQAADQTAAAQKVLSSLHHANQTEIVMARMAKEKGASGQVRAYADRLMKDHGDADRQVQAVAQKNGITLVAPSTSGFFDRIVAAREERTLANLSKKTGEDFDKTFTDAMIDDHMRDINNLESAENSLPPGDVHDLIAKLLPTLQQHLEQAQEIQKS